MSTRGWENVSIHAIRRRVATNQLDPVNLKNEPPARSKYRNVKTRLDGILFDSKKEATHWLVLRAREQAGEIGHLRRQVVFPLCCPSPDHRQLVVANYIADFCYEQGGQRHVVDAKGVKTQMFALKAKWLFLQDAITIELV